MDNTRQAEVLKNVLELEKTIVNTRRKISSIRTQKFKGAPKPPTRNTVTRTYPKIVSGITFSKKKAFLPVIASIVICPILALLLGAIPILGNIIALIPTACVIWIIYYFLIVYRKGKKEDIERIKNSAEYKAKCEEADREFDRLQAEYDQSYQNAKEEYDTKVLPQYEKELAEWTTLRDNQLKEAESQLFKAESELRDLYTETKIVPVQYRNIEALQYIYDMVSSSDYDVKQAIDSYDKKVQRDLDMEKIEEQRIANQIADEEAYLLERQNKIAEKARRDANISSAVGMAQRHKTNKMLKEMSSKKKRR